MADWSRRGSPSWRRASLLVALDERMSAAAPSAQGCLLCDVAGTDVFYRRQRLHKDQHWRLSAVLQGPIVSFAHLEPRRHIPSHLHFDLAQHQDGDGQRGGPGMLEPSTPDRDLADHQRVARAARDALAGLARPDQGIHWP